MSADPHRALLRALGPLLPPAAAVRRSTAVPWASITFTGARHKIAVEIADARLARELAAALPAAEFALPGHIVADISARVEDRTLRIEALTVEIA